jgi:predicted ribosome quality control (RQC) complex YloA/Tae2 family protein
MAMDGIALGAVVSECRTLIGGKIDKVQQPEKDLLLFTVRNNGKTQKLLFCTHAENGRIQLTSRAYDNPAQPPALCMLLRRRLCGARITDVRQIGADRVCELSLLARNELFDEVTLKLVAELTGKHANLFLLEPDGSIADCVRRVSAGDTSTRILLPGFPYEPIPAQDKCSPFDATREQLDAVYASADPARALTQAFAGVSRQSANALVSACASSAALKALFLQMKNGRYSPCIAYLPDGEPAAALPFTPNGMFAKTEPCENMSDALDRYYAGRDALVRIRRHGGELRKTVSNALRRAQNKYAAFVEAITGTERFEEARTYGELILANLHLVRPGADELIALDYCADPPQKRAVPLDPALSAQENAKKYFKAYRKGKLGKAYAESQIESLSAEIAYLEGQLENIEKCETLYELTEIRDELVRERYIRPSRDKKRAPGPGNRSSAPMRFVSSDDIGILVGKNNRQNDALTLQQAKSDNLWLHAKNIPGSHVIVDFEGEPPERTLQEAAMLAAYYSKARLSSGVPVDYTPRKFVKKPSGARPGMVIYSTNRTLYVTPDPALVQRLRIGE